MPYARRRYRCASCSQVKPMPPSTWMQSLTLALAAAMPTLAASAAAMDELVVVGVACGAGGVGGGHPGLLGAAQHLGAHVLDRLEAADRLAELLAHLRVFDGGLEASNAPSRPPRPPARSRPAPRPAPATRDGVAGADVSTTRANGREKSVAFSGSTCTPSPPVSTSSQSRRTAAPARRRGAEHQDDGARHSAASVSNCTSPSRATPAMRSPEASAASSSGIGDDQGCQRRGGDRAGHQRVGRLLDHRAQVLDAAAGAAGLLGHRHAEQAQVGQPAEPGARRRPCPVRPLARSSRARSRIPRPITHQFTRGELLVGDGRST